MTHAGLILMNTLRNRTTLAFIQRTPLLTHNSELRGQCLIDSSANCAKHSTTARF